MAQVPYTKVIGEGGTITFYWTLANGDYGDSLNLSSFSDKCVHIYGTFGSGGSATLYGSNNTADFNTSPSGGTWVALVDPQGNAITKTSAAIEQVLENPRSIAPRVTAGDGTTSLTIAINVKRTF